MKNHSCNLHAPICGIFCLHSVGVARYAALIQAKSPTNCNSHLAESIFHSSRHCQNHRSIILPICGLGASVGCERTERTFNTPRRKSQMGRIVLRWFVSLSVWYFRMMVRQFALNTKLSTSSVLLKHFVVIYIIKLREYYHTDRSTR